MKSQMNVHDVNNTILNGKVNLNLIYTYILIARQYKRQGTVIKLRKFSF